MRLQPVSRVAAPLLAALHKVSFKSHADWDEDFFLKLLNLPTTRGLIALIDDTPVGFILWQQTPDTGEVITIAVRPDHQRRGIGRRILDAYERTLGEDGVAESVLDVAADNLPAQRLYGSAGYATAHRRANYYQLYENGVEKRVDALVLQKTI